MKKQICAIALALCLCMFSGSVAYAGQGYSLKQENIPMGEETDKLVVYVGQFTQTDIYNAIIAMKEKYPDGMRWTNDEPYGSNGDQGYSYSWRGASENGRGCAAFAFELSDAAFGSLPARKYMKGEFEFEDIRVGDVLRINNDKHSIIVLEISDDEIVAAEGNVGGKVRWGRKRSKDSIMSKITYCYTRYPKKYTLPENQDVTGSSSAVNTGTAALSYEVEFMQKDVYDDMNLLKGRQKYKEGKTWTDDEPYGNNTKAYTWNGNHESGIGSAAFAFELSDMIFCGSPAKKYAKGEFKFEHIRVGDVLRMDNDTHSVVVLKVKDDGVVVAEGNYNGNGKVNWGRTISKEEVMSTTNYYYTRYPEKYILRENPYGVGKKFTVNDINYEITATGDIKTVKVISVKKGIKTVIIPSVITIDGHSYQVTAIDDNAFKDNKILLEVEIGTNINSIGENAFSGCKKLKNIVIKSKKLTAEKVGKDTFKGINSNATIKVPKNKIKEYKKIIKARGAGKNVKIKY